MDVGGYVLNSVDLSVGVNVDLLLIVFIYGVSGNLCD